MKNKHDRKVWLQIKSICVVALTAWAFNSIAAGSTPSGRLAAESPLRVDVRIANAQQFCLDTADLASCSGIAEGQPDALLIGPGKPVLFHYVVHNDGSAPLVLIDFVDQTFGAVVTSTDLLQPGDSRVFRRIYDAPSTAGILSSSAEASAEDGGGNAITASDDYTIEVPAPQLRIDARIARASDLCGDPADVTTCASLPEGQSDTLLVDPGERVLVDYVVTNEGSSVLEGIDVTDSGFGPIGTATAPLAQGDELRFSRIHDAPAGVGQFLFTADVTAQDRGGNSASDSDEYSLKLRSPQVALSRVRIEFGDIPIGLQSDLEILFIDNVGDAFLTIADITVEGSAAPDFVIAPSDDMCSDQTLLPGGTCGLGVRFLPEAPGIRAARLRIPTNDPDGERFVDLLGTSDVVYFSGFE